MYRKIVDFLKEVYTEKDYDFDKDGAFISKRAVRWHRVFLTLATIWLVVVLGYWAVWFMLHTPLMDVLYYITWFISGIAFVYVLATSVSW
jgi:uncharacterized membrane protein YukC